MERLPIEITRYLLSFLDVESLIRATKVCKLLHEEIESKREWQWRIDRLGLIDLGSDVMPSMKYQVVERVRIIRAFRRFVEYPRGPEFVFISTILFPPWNIDVPAMVAKTMMEATYLAERCVGIRPLGSMMSLDSWLSLLKTAWIDMRCPYGISMRRLDHEDLYVHGLHAVGYIVWQTLHEEWGQTDIRADPEFWVVRNKRISGCGERMTLKHVLSPFQMEVSPYSTITDFLRSGEKIDS